LKSTEAIIQLFSQKGLKITPQRRLIFELLAEDHNHPTAESLYQQVILRMPDVSQTTVYNTLRELVALGELVPVDNLKEAVTRFDTNPIHHNHLLCLNCQTLVDIDRVFPDVELSKEEAKGYQIVNKQVTFYGICQECQKI
jgi:Fe2+ or Zn2+ uptake regulation protein